MNSTYLTRRFVLLGSSVLAAGSVAVADPAATRAYTSILSTHANLEGVAVDPRRGAFYVGATRDGTLHRGTLDSPGAQGSIPGAAGKSAVGSFRGGVTLGFWIRDAA